MDLVSYLDARKVHIILMDGFFYIGKPLDADENSITILDKNGHKVSVKKESISSIKEVFV